MSIKPYDKVSIPSQNVKGKVVHIHQNQHIAEVKTNHGYQLTVPLSQVTKISDK